MQNDEKNQRRKKQNTAWTTITITINSNNNDDDDKHKFERNYNITVLKVRDFSFSMIMMTNSLVLKKCKMQATWSGAAACVFFSFVTSAKYIVKRCCSYTK